MKVQVSSPISGKPAKLIQTIEVSRVEELYKKEYGITVGKYFGNAKHISIYECNETGYRFYFPFDMGGDSAFYAALQKSGNYYPEWKWENEKSLGFMNPNDLVLDVGCGEGNFLKELYKRNFKNLNGIDQSSDSLSYSETDAIHIYNDTIETHSKNNADKYEVLVCFQVLEHVSDVHSFITKCLSCLKPGGILIIAVPNNNPYLYRHDLYHTLNLPPHHAGLWNKHTLDALSHYFGLKLLHNEVQPISQNISEYTLVQMAHLGASSSLLKWLFGFTFVKKIYSKLLYTRKNKIEGRNCLAVYQKINNLH